MPVNMLFLTSLLFTTGFFGGGSCLKLTELKVPKHADLGSSVTLECAFDLGRAKLYSVKWYKDDFEFFRYMPSDEKTTSTFKVDGIKLDEMRSGKNRVTLTDLEYRSSGIYRCEVSTEAPNFNTSLQSKNMTVLAFPDRPPMITGVQDSYAMTEYIHANCTSGKSNPGPRLAWYINGREPDSWYVIESGLMELDGPLYARQVSLQYPASKILQGKESVSINCTSLVADMPPVTSSVLTRVASASANQQLSQERLHNSGVTVGGLWSLLVAACLLANS